ncbi:MAG: NADH:ubiquinone reductase (Na(+)-transporting) subunit B [Bacteroidales bacterium]|jgi:Na+-transporting NADH:ubiquinone oxidoreductase subunit B|nr:NADH:ubiquinone reductase (Na(+)-transporting) subunit B [Bacteroidales bacterium]
MLKSFIDRIKPDFEPNGKFSFLHSTFEAFESFLYVPDKVTTRGTHIRDPFDMKRAMIMVVIALVPCALFGMYNVGYQHYLATGTIVEQGFWNIFAYGLWKIAPLFIISYVVGLGIEFAFAEFRKHEVNEGFLVSGFLIPLISPPDIPLWILALSTAFAVIIGKEIFGGTGMNIWNPALLARAFMFFAYPSQISGDSVWVVDAVSAATPLSNVAQGAIDMLPSTDELFWGLIPGSVGETSKFCILLGAIILLWTRIASARTMFAVIAGGGLLAFILNVSGVTEVTALQQLLMGGFLFGAVFMATDPVTSANTNRGKWIYGLLIGMIAVVIRVFNPAYPEGMMLAILLMNTFAPLIDYLVVDGNIRKRKKRVKVVVSGSGAADTKPARMVQIDEI